MDVPGSIERLIVDVLPQILWLADARGGVTEVNRFWTEYTGLSREAALGNRWAASLHPDDVAPARALARESIARGEDWSSKVRIRRKDGVYRWFLSTARPLRGDDGRPCAWAGVLNDIEHQVQIERSLSADATRYQELAEASDEGIWTVDAEGKTDYINRRGAELLGCTVEEIIGRSPCDFYFAEERAGAEARLAERRLGTSQRHDVRLRRRDGGELWTHIVALPLIGDDGTYRGALAMFSDISARKRAEQQLREYSDDLRTLSRSLLETQESERGDLARELHDEIGQILTVVSMNLHATRRLIPPAAERRIDESIKIIDHAIQQVRSISLELRPSMLDDLGLDAALRWYVDRQAQRTGLLIQLSLQLLERLPSDLESTCFRIIQEGVTNATRHARARHVWVMVRQSLQALDLCVRDDGVGFDPEAARRRATSGACIGLLGMRERARLAGGRLDVESSPAHGSEIRVRIPREPRGEATPS